jgi:hypothetical protein
MITPNQRRPKMKFVTREDIDLSVPDDPELIRRRKEVRRRIHAEMNKAWADPVNQRMSHEDFMRQCHERVMQEYDEKFIQETLEMEREAKEQRNQVTT